MLLETEARDLAMAYGVVAVPATFCADADEAAAAAHKVGGPVAIKAVAGGVLHKTEAGGVRIGVPPAEAASAFAAIAAAVRTYCQKRGADPDLRGMLVAPALPKPIVELLVGYKKDPHYGGVIVVGLGGTTVEVLKDVTLRLLPLSRDDARAMLAEIKGARLLRGHRGAPAVDREAIVDTIMALAACARSNPEIVEMEINPLFAYEHGAVAVDVRALL